MVECCVCIIEMGGVEQVAAVSSVNLGSTFDILKDVLCTIYFDIVYETKINIVTFLHLSSYSSLRAEALGPSCKATILSFFTAL